MKFRNARTLIALASLVSLAACGGGGGGENADALEEKLSKVDLLVIDEVHVRDSNKEWQDHRLTDLAPRRSTLATAPMCCESAGTSGWQR